MLGVPAQGTVGVPINLSSTVTDVSPVDTAAGFQYIWQAFGHDNDNNDYFSGSSADFSFTPTGTGPYDIYLYVQDKDGGYDFVSRAAGRQRQWRRRHRADGDPRRQLAHQRRRHLHAPAVPSPILTPATRGPPRSTTATARGVQPLALNADNTFNLSHVYADNGGFDVTVAVTDSSGSTGTQTTHVTVNNVAPAVTLANPSPVAVDAVFSLAGSFTDPGDDTWTAKVNYGDGTGDLPLVAGRRQNVRAEPHLSIGRHLQRRRHRHRRRWRRRHGHRRRKS